MNNELDHLDRPKFVPLLLILAPFLIGLVLPYCRIQYFHWSLGELCYIDLWGWEWICKGWAYWIGFGATFASLLSLVWLALPCLLFGSILFHFRLFPISFAVFLLAIAVHSIFWFDNQLSQQPKYIGAYLHLFSIILACGLSLLYSIKQFQRIDPRKGKRGRARMAQS